jgi:hypothetical protein
VLDPDQPVRIASPQSDQDPCCSLSVSVLVIELVSEQHGSLSDCGCAGWSGSMLVANALCWFCHDAAQIILKLYISIITEHMLNKEECEWNRFYHVHKISLKHSKCNVILFLCSNFLTYDYYLFSFAFYNSFNTSKFFPITFDFMLIIECLVLCVRYRILSHLCYMLVIMILLSHFSEIYKVYSL